MFAEKRMEAIYKADAATTVELAGATQRNEVRAEVMAVPWLGGERLRGGVTQRNGVRAGRCWVFWSFGWEGSKRCLSSNRK